MKFDETEYREYFLKKHRGARGAPGDLLTRYAIKLPATDAEIAAQVKAVRAYWNKIYHSPSSFGQVAKLCRAEDERLKAEHGAKMETRAWWQARQSDAQQAAEGSIAMMADDLRRRFSTLGVITSAMLAQFAGKLGLTMVQANQAAQRAGVIVIDGVSLPTTEPIGNFSALVKAMAECGVPSVPALVHPGSGTFRLVERYECLADDRKRLDADAVEAQRVAAEKRGISATENARRGALSILSHALRDGVDLRDVSLYQMVTIAQGLVAVSIDLAAKELRETGIDARDAAAIAVLTAEQHSISGAAPSSRIVGLSAHQRTSPPKTAPSLVSPSQETEAESPPTSTEAKTVPRETPLFGISQEPVKHLTLRRRVQLGIPTALPITRHELENDKYLASAVSSRDDLRFCLLRITPTFHEGRGGVIMEAYVEVTLEIHDNVKDASPKVWSMSPLVVEEESNHSRNIKGSGGGSVSQASVGFNSSFQKHEPFITAYGIQSAVAYWKFTRTRGREIRGSHTLEMVVCMPKRYNAEALIEIHGMVRKRRFGFLPTRGNMGNDSCSITLPVGAVEQVTIDSRRDIK